MCKRSGEQTCRDEDVVLVAAIKGAPKLSEGGRTMRLLVTGGVLAVCR